MKAILCEGQYKQCCVKANVSNVVKANVSNVVRRPM